MTYRNEDVTINWIQSVFGLLSSIPTAVVWALLWLICLPYTWTLLPWGPFETNWWKIFPYLFGIIWVGGLPLLLVVINFFRKLTNREYNHDINKLEEEVIEEESIQPSAEETNTTESIKKIQSALKQSNEAKKNNFWDSVK